MQSEVKEWKQLNNIPDSSLYIEFPIDFTGKKKGDRASVFSGLALSAQYILGYIHTMNKINGGKPAKIIYYDFINVFGMSRETVSAGIKILEKLGIIECVKQSRYKIKVQYNKTDCLEIDTYLLKREWEMNGKKKRLARSRILILALLKRGVTNPKTDGIFISSQSRIGKAVNLPKSTAGDSVRELSALSVISYEKQNGNDKQKRGCSLFEVNPQILAVKHPYLSLQAFKAMFGVDQPNPDELHSRLMLDIDYFDIIERINLNYEAQVKEIRLSRGEDTPELAELEAKQVKLGDELEAYFKIHKVNRQIFPLGFFRTDTTEDTEI